MTYSVPILVIAFNRPEPTLGLLQILRRLQPTRLYLAFDGPRADKPSDVERCETVRNLCRNGIDWPCQAFWLIRDRNLGCRFAVSSAIDWFFEHESEGVILEDDIHPILGFFGYCAELLDRYRYDTRVGAIAGNNHQSGLPVDGSSYYFSIYSHCWGWATWRRAWLKYHQSAPLWPSFRDQGWLRQIGGAGFEKRWRFLINQVYYGEVDAWDILWQLACWQQGFLTCLPAQEQVVNVGFDRDATHTLDERSPLQSPRELPLPLSHPDIILASKSFDKITFNRLYRRNISMDLKRRFLKLLRLLGCR